MLEKACWISENGIEGCPIFQRNFVLKSEIKLAILRITALGVYSANLNGTRVGDFKLAPGWTVYRHRVQVQEYDVTNLLSYENILLVTVGNGWYLSRMSHWLHPDNKQPSIIAELCVKYEDGTVDSIVTDDNWQVYESKTRFSDIYDGEHYDAGYIAPAKQRAEIRSIPEITLVEQCGEKVIATDWIYPTKRFLTPNGEYVIDFGQELTGTLHMKLKSNTVKTVRITCGEMLDKDGNFYNENYRTAKSEMLYTCIEGEQEWEPEFTFFGFRYIKIEGLEFGEGDFVAIVLCSDIKRVGYITSGVAKLNRLFENAVWGQKGNFLDVPTDCPQRNERYGWTGDAQAFINTACWQYDVKTFFSKWLDDVMYEQRKNGALPNFIPDISVSFNKDDISSSAAWGDAATICPFQMYRHYGDKSLLAKHYEMMKKWLAYIASATKEEHLWIGGEHFGDWLGLDAEEGSYTGRSNKDLIASAFYYHSAYLTLQAGKEIGADVSDIECLVDNISKAFNKKFTSFNTQTECAIVLYFGLTERKNEVAKNLVNLIMDNDIHLTTGFVGTPYLLYALSQNGYADIAYSLLLQESYPSWLYSVNNGATTIWEHWDGKKSDGSFWSSDMNSFNHYAYGAFVSWVFEEASGIKPLEAGFRKVIIEPKPDKRLGTLCAEYNSKSGRIVSCWSFEDDRIRYDITVPVESLIIIDGKEYNVSAGSYIF